MWNTFCALSCFWSFCINFYQMPLACSIATLSNVLGCISAYWPAKCIKFTVLVFTIHPALKWKTLAVIGHEEKKIALFLNCPGWKMAELKYHLTGEVPIVLDSRFISGNTFWNDVMRSNPKACIMDVYKVHADPHWADDKAKIMPYWLQRQKEIKMNNSVCLKLF